MNDSHVAVRRASAPDAQRLVQIHYNAVQGVSSEFYAPSLLDSWSPPPDSDRYEWMQNVIESDSRDVFVAELQDVICGFSICVPSESSIYVLYIAPDFVGRGIGRKLLEHTESHLTREGVSCSSLNSSLNAVQFYKAAGYEVIRASSQALADGSEMRCYKMQKVLQLT